MKTWRERISQFWLDLPQGIRPGVVVVLALLVLGIILAVWPRSAKAADSIEVLVARAGKDELRLYNSQCMNAGVLAMIKPDWRDKYRKGYAYIGGAFFWACWLTQDDGNVFILFDDGDQLVLNPAVFKRDEGV